MPPRPASVEFSWLRLLQKSSLWRRVGVGRARRNRWILLQTLLELRHELHSRNCHPRVQDQSLWVLLLRIGNKVEPLRGAELGGWGPPVALLVVEDHLPVPPLDRLQAIGHEHREAFAVGRVRL